MRAGARRCSNDGRSTVAELIAHESAAPRARRTARADPDRPRLPLHARIPGAQAQVRSRRRPDRDREDGEQREPRRGQRDDSRHLARVGRRGRRGRPRARTAPRWRRRRHARRVQLALRRRRRPSSRSTGRRVGLPLRRRRPCAPRAWRCRSCAPSSRRALRRPLRPSQLFAARRWTHRRAPAPPDPAADPVALGRSAASIGPGSSQSAAGSEGPQRAAQPSRD